MEGMELKQLVESIDAVRATSKKTEKIQILATLLKQAQGRDLEFVAHYLVGTLPQGKIGVGWRFIEAAVTDVPDAESDLNLSKVDEVKALRWILERAPPPEGSVLCVASSNAQLSPSETF